MMKYFRCRYFKGNALWNTIIEAESEDKAREQFSRKFKKYNLIEITKI